MKNSVNPEYLLEVRKIIGKWLREIREEKGMTQEQLGQKIGVDRSTVNKIENGKWSFSIDMLTRFCVALETHFFLSTNDSNTEVAQMMRKRWERGGQQN